MCKYGEVKVSAVCSGGTYSDHWAVKGYNVNAKYEVPNAASRIWSSDMKGRAVRQQSASVQEIP